MKSGILKVCKAGILAYITLLSAFSDDGMVAMGIVLVAFFVMYYSFEKAFSEKIQYVQKGACVVGCLLAICMIFGNSLERFGDFSGIWGTAGSVFRSMLCFLGFAYFFYVIVYTIYHMMIYKKWENPILINSKICTLIFDRKPWLIVSGLLFLFWLPYLIAFFPGAVTWDGLRQLDFYIGSLEWTKFHPVFSTWLMGSIVTLGQGLFHSDNAGVFLYTILQVLCTVLCLGYGMTVLRKWGTPYLFRICILLFFALCVMWPGYAYAYIKDTSFMLAAFIHSILLFEAALEKEQFSLYKWGIIALSGLAICLLRNNGIYNLVLSVPAILLFFKSQRKTVFLCFGSAILVFLLFDYVYVPSKGIGKGDVAEMLSIPFQQTARYVKYYGDEVTPEEEATIRAVLDYDSLADIYEPEVSDPVKGSYARVRQDGRDLIPYFQTWVKQLMKHPMVYIEATANNIYGYFYPLYRPREIAHYGIVQDTYVNRGDFQFTVPNEDSFLYKFLCDNIQQQPQYPIVGLLYTTGFWNWLLLIGTVFLCIIKKWRYVALTVPLWLTLLVCLASPVNAYMRYLISNVMILPFYGAWMWKLKDV